MLTVRERNSSHLSWIGRRSHSRIPPKCAIVRPIFVGPIVEERLREQGRQTVVSKSSYLAGLQCGKLVWHRFNARHQFPPVDEATQAIFDQGHEVGEQAKKLFPTGIELGAGASSIDEVLARTSEAVQRRVPLFEPGFVYESAYVQIDILNPVPGDEWDLIEVKSSTSLKDEHLSDIAFQAYVVAGAGLKIRRCVLAHINPEFVKSGAIHPGQFFILEDVTQRAMAITRDIAEHLHELSATIRLPICPDVQIGLHCDTPYGCPLQDQCWSFLPEGNVTSLYRDRAKGFKLLAEGIQLLADIPDDFKLTDNQEIQRQTAKTGQPHIDEPAIAKFLGQLKYPVSCL